MKRTALTVAILFAAPVLAACGTESTESTNPDGGDAADARSLSVDSSDDACDLSATEAPAGVLNFDVTNSGSAVTEFYFLGDDGVRVVAELENIGPGATQQLTISAPAGSYITACKPGMVGDGIRADFTVTESDQTVDEADAQLIEQAQTHYAAYVKDQTSQLLEKTRKFVELYQAGDQDDAARALYPVARTHWERIETVAESFGDLDPLMDAREADIQAGEEWTGWHRIEKDLWPARAGKYRALTPDERTRYSEDLLVNTEELDTRVQSLTYSIDIIANGSRGLLEEVAIGKVTGEEEYWSRTDLWDFQANVDGARVGFEGVAPIVEHKDHELAEQLEDRFADLQALLDEQRRGDGFVYYDELSQAEIKKLSDAVNALSEPLGRLSAVVLS